MKRVGDSESPRLHDFVPTGWAKQRDNSMKTLITPRFATAVLIAALTGAFALSAQGAAPGHALAPFEITGTPLPEPTGTTPPRPTVPPAPSVTPAPGSTAQPPSSHVPLPSRPLADPYVKLSGCSACLIAGETAELTAIVSNQGGMDAVNVQLLSAVPAYLELIEIVPSRGSVTTAQGAPTVDISTVAPNEIVTVKFKLRLKRDVVQGDALYAVKIETTSAGDDVLNNAALAQCAVCQITLPVTGADLPYTDQTAAIVLLMMGAMLAISGWRLTDTQR